MSCTGSDRKPPISRGLSLAEGSPGGRTRLDWLHNPLGEAGSSPLSAAFLSGIGNLFEMENSAT